ncbi:MAG TPA: GGDEF domain-containing protein [Patescibacteria group bacterium]|nr:GGDEF domain-containing protein [Patescibacteria group bacterium]
MAEGKPPERRRSINAVQQKLKGYQSRLIDISPDSPHLSLTRAYLCAFAIIAALTLIGHFMVSYTISKQKDDAEVTFTMTTMRSLIDIAVSNATAYKMSGKDFDGKLLAGAIKRLRDSRQQLKYYDDPDVERMFRENPYFLDKHMTAFIESAEDFASYRSTDKFEKFTEEYNQLWRRLSKSFSINLDQAIEQYHGSVTEQIAWSHRLQYITAIIVLLVLILEAFYIFRPLVTRLSAYSKELIRLALEDELTGLKNRRAVMQLANAEMSRFNRSGKPFALVLCDLDKFKSVNDTYGHKVGDLVLKHYAKLLRNSLRGYDIVGRFGGEEFVIMLPQTEPEAALSIINRFRETVANTPCPYIDKDNKQQMLKFTSSFGIAAVTLHRPWSLDTLLIRADECLYEAKDKGRNCAVMVVLDTPPTPGTPEEQPAA